MPDKTLGDLLQEAFNGANWLLDKIDEFVDETDTPAPVNTEAPEPDADETIHNVIATGSQLELVYDALRLFSEAVEVVSSNPERESQVQHLLDYIDAELRSQGR